MIRELSKTQSARNGLRFLVALALAVSGIALFRAEPVLAFALVGAAGAAILATVVQREPRRIPVPVKDDHHR